MVSAIILNWKRPQNLQTILFDSLFQNEKIDEIIIWNNNPEIKLDGFIPNYKPVKIINTNHPNMMGMNCRWYAAMMAQNQHIYMQDDDRWVSQETLNELIDLIGLDPNRQYGLDPRRLVGNTYDGNINFGQDPHKEAGKRQEAECILTGTTVFHKQCLPYVLHCLNNFPQNKQNDIHDGEDLFFSYALRAFYQKKPILISKRVKGKHWCNLAQNDAIRDRPGRDRASLLRYWSEYKFPTYEKLNDSHSS